MLEAVKPVLLEKVDIIWSQFTLSSPTRYRLSIPLSTLSHSLSHSPPSNDRLSTMSLLV